MAQMNNNQMNNNQMNNRNMQVNKPMENHSWAIKELTRNDVLAVNQWPIKVVRDDGKQTKMEIRSITDFNKSFEGTKYNLVQCPKVRSRYTLLYNELIKHSQDISNISHLAITYDTVYYVVNTEVKKADGKLDKKSEFKFFPYATNIFKDDDVERVTNGVLLSSKYFDNLIKDSFNDFSLMYKKVQIEAKQSKVKDSDFRAYIRRTSEYNNFYKTMSFVLNSRQKIKTVDNVKPLIDILKSELNFTNLEYLFFIPYPNEAIDYSEIINQRLLAKPYNLDYRESPILIEELKRIPSLNIEEPSYYKFIEELRAKKHQRTIRKAYLYPSNDVTPKSVFKLFKDIMNPENTIKPIYVSDAEKARETKKAMKEAEDNEKIQKYVESANKIRESIKNTHSEILNMLSIINTMVRCSDEIHKKGLEINNVEYGIWINQYDIATMKSIINAVFEHRREKDEEGRSVVVELYPISKIFTEVQEKIGMKDSLDWKFELKYFYENIRPSYFSNETLGVENLNISKLNIDVSSLDSIKEVVSNLQNLEKIMNNIKNNFMFLTEVVLGVQYATFGKFMIRYGAGTGGVAMTKMLIPDLVTEYSQKSFNTTKHVKYSANLAFYAIQLTLENLKNYKPETASTMSDTNGIGKLAYFVNTYLEAISGKEVEDLKHINENEKYTNLIIVSNHIAAILATCCKLVHLDANSSENIMNRYNALMEDINNKIG